MQMSKNTQRVFQIPECSFNFKGFIVLDNYGTKPAIGGCRFMPYHNEAEALEDARRLASNMSYKCAMAGVNYSGGKAVIMLPRGHIDREAIFKRFGQFVQGLGGQYITAIDSGTTVADMQRVSAETPYVAGFANQLGQNIDPSYYTALGVLKSIDTCVAHRFSSPELKKLHFLVKGVGNVGRHMVRFLKERGANITVSDLDSLKAESCKNDFGVQIIDPKKVFEKSYDVICPCDVQHTVTENNVMDIKTKVIAGATNNQMESEEVAEKIWQKNILYCPDFVSNAGGLLYVLNLYEGRRIEETEEMIHKHAKKTSDVLNYAHEKAIPQTKAAYLLAERFMENADPQDSLERNMQ